MVKNMYVLNRKRMYLDKEVYRSVQDFNITWNDINDETDRLRAVGHPKPNYNTAAMILLAKKAGTDTVFSKKNSSVFVPGFGSSKKGFVGDNITLIVSLMIMISMVVLFAFYVANQNESIQSSNLDSTFKTTFDTSVGGFPSAVDKGIVVGIVILVSFLLYSAYTIGTNFSLFIMALLLNAVALFILPYAEDFLISSFYNNNFVDVISLMPGTFFIINHYALFLTGVAVLLLIALFMRPSTGDYAA